MVIYSRSVMRLVSALARKLGTIPEGSRVAGLALPPLVVVDPDVAPIARLRVLQHEGIHVDQWAEVTLLGCVFGLGITLGFGVSVPSGVAYVSLMLLWHALYVALWLVGLVRYRSARKAYRLHPMEREAYEYEEDRWYRYGRRVPFAWVPYLWR